MDDPTDHRPGDPLDQAPGGKSRAPGARPVESRRPIADDRDFDGLLQRVLNDVEVPQDLPVRIRARHEERLRQERRQRWWALAAAAGIAAIAVFATTLLPRTAALPEAVLAHIEGEPEHLEEDTGVPPKQVAALVGNAGGRVTRPLGHVRFAGACVIRDRLGVHLVLNGAVAPVTVLLMPGEYVPERLLLRDQRFRGLVVPITGGSMALVGEAGERLDAMEHRLHDALDWPVTG